MRARKHYPRDRQEGGSEGAGAGQERAQSNSTGERAPTGANGIHGGRAGAEERGDPKISRGANRDIRPDPGTRGASG